MGYHPKLSKQNCTIVKERTQGLHCPIQILLLPLASYGKWLDLVAPLLRQL